MGICEADDWPCATAGGLGVVSMVWVATFEWAGAIWRVEVCVALLAVC